MAGKYNKLIMQTAREHFAEVGYYGSRIDAIAEKAHLNRKIIYDFCHTKDELYMAVLSEVSREISAYFDENMHLLTGTIPNIYGELFCILENFSDFLRIWAWERMSPTIHGPRILETANSIFEKTRILIQEHAQKGELKQNINSDIFEPIEALCHGYLLTAAMYFRCDPETDEPQVSESGLQNSPALKRLDMSMKIQDIMLNSIEQLIMVGE